MDDSENRGGTSWGYGDEGVNDIRDVLEAQNGSLTVAQARACGLSTSAIRTRIERGDWERVLPRVVRATDRQDLPRDRVRRAGLWAGDSGTVVGLAAAAWWHLRDEVPERVRVVRPPGTSGRAPGGVSLRRGCIPPQDRLIVDGIGVTKRARTVLDAGVELGLVDGARLMDRALQQNRVDLDGLCDALRRRLGARGTPLAVELVALAAGGARSEAERATIHGLRAAGIGGFAVNHALDITGWGRVVLDIVFLDARLVVEVDGWAFHRDVDRFRHDARRQNAVVAAGWRVLRLTWYDVRGDAAAAIATIVTAIAT